ncbi:MAG: 7-cyano-7-deazaguanine synthase [Myxococcales bacterium]|nr:7-cyano-7-deazaguanine synthase [Myxococcales bacterium]
MTRSALVLVSGGLDSAATLALYRREEGAITALFVDYGQVAAALERAAAHRVAEHFGVALAEVTCAGLGPYGGGYIRGRNALLLHIALAAAPFEAGHIAIGIHGGTPHVDCSIGFVEEMQRDFDVYCNGTMRVVAPFVGWDKREVLEFGREEGVPLASTYSCQRGTEPPCGHCLSCLDREALRVE